MLASHAKDTPWGQWEVLLDEPQYKVKRITVNPGHRLSYQRHQKRQEHWMIVAGQGEVTLEGACQTVRAGQSVDIPMQAWHRMTNASKEPLTFIEIQTGSYFGEDDIERSEDDYGRQDKP